MPELMVCRIFRGATRTPPPGPQSCAVLLVEIAGRRRPLTIGLSAEAVAMLRAMLAR